MGEHSPSEFYFCESAEAITVLVLSLIHIFHNLDDFLFQFIQAIGYIMAGYGAVQVGLSFKTQDASQKSAGLMTLAGGILVIFARSIISLITGG